MTRPGVARWRTAALGAVAAGAIAPLGAARWARGQYGRDLAAKSAASTAAYLALVTPAAPGGTAYVLPQLLIRSRALLELPGFAARIEVYHGTAPLLEATAPPLAAAALAALRASPTRAPTTERGRALAPLVDPAGEAVVGAVAAWSALPAGLWTFAEAGALMLVLAYGALAVGAAGARGAARRRAIRRYGAAAGVLGVIAYADVRAAARADTDRWLRDARLLMQEAATRLPEVRTAPSVLAPIAGAAEIVPGDSAGSEPTRRRVAGLARAALAVRLGPGHWAELRSAPEEAGTAGWCAAVLSLALLGPLGIAGAAWWAGAATRPRHVRETAAAWGFLAPSALHLLAFSVVPIGFAAYVSLHRWSLVEPGRPFVGLANYARALHDPLAWGALGHTVLYALYVPVSAALALALAVLLNRGSWTARALRTVVFLPAAASGVAVAVLWQWLYQPEDGGVNALLRLAGRAQGVDWLGDPRTALLALMLVSLWVQVGYQMTVFLAALQGIPRAYLDWARVEGAGAWRRFSRVTLPLLRPVTGFVLATGLIGAVQVFSYVYVLTGGGPGYATDVLVYRIYQTGWQFLQFGYASALALLAGVGLFALTWAQFRLLERRVARA